MHSLSSGKILVTGGAGFIGSALIWALNERGIDNILVADYLADGDQFKNLVPLRFEDYIEADKLLECIALEDPCLSDITTIFHLGACSSTTEQDAAYLIENNYEYTKTLAHWALKHGARFAYASSAATYGDGEQGMDDKLEDLHALRPLNMYGYSKHLFDLYAKRNGILGTIVGLKYFNIFGPNENHKADMRSVVYKALEQIQTTGHVKLFKSYRPEFKDGEQKRDFLYVKDAVAMTLFLAENKSANGLFNLGSGEANTWLSLINAIFGALEKEPSIEFIDMPDYLRQKYQYFTQADISKLRAAGFEQSLTPLKEAVTDTIQNYLLPQKHLGDVITLA